MYIFWPKLLRWNFFLLQISQLSILSGAHKVFRRFLDFSQFFYRTFANIVAKSNDENENCAARLEGLSILKKGRKPHQNRPINCNTLHVMFELWTLRTNIAPATGA